MNAPTWTDDFNYLEAWFASLELTIDGPVPAGLEDKGPAEVMRAYAALARDRSQQEGWTPGHLTPKAVVDSYRDPQLPVFSARWKTSLEGRGPDLLDRFVVFGLRPELGEHWDSTFVNAQRLASHGSTDSLAQHALLYRYQFSAPPLKRREMMYLVIPTLRMEGDTLRDVLFLYLSVTSPQFPTTQGYIKCRNLVPSYDWGRLLSDNGMQHVQVEHLMSTEIEGRIPNWLWNLGFKAPLLKANLHESQQVRKFIEAHPSVRE